MNIVDEVHAYVKAACEDKSNEYGMAPYHHHFVAVVDYATKLAQLREANVQVVQIAAWFHDIGSIKGDAQNHHISGAKIAETFLQAHNYPQQKIDAIKHCILAHRGSQNIPRESKEAECVADADAMAHFDNVVSLFRLAMVTKKMDEHQAKTFVREKLQRSYNKLTFDAQQLIKPRYEAAMLLLEEKK